MREAHAEWQHLAEKDKSMYEERGTAMKRKKEEEANTEQGKRKRIVELWQKQADIVSLTHFLTCFPFTKMSYL